MNKEENKRTDAVRDNADATPQERNAAHGANQQQGAGHDPMDQIEGRMNNGETGGGGKKEGEATR